MIQLPIYKIKNKFYFRDLKLNEYRNIKNFNDILKFNEVSLKDLQKSNQNDFKKLTEQNLSNIALNLPIKKGVIKK